MYKEQKDDSHMLYIRNYFECNLMCSVQYIVYIYFIRSVLNLNPHKSLHLFVCFEAPFIAENALSETF